VVAVFLTKCSVALFLLRLSSSKNHNLASKGTLTAATVFMILSIFLVALRSDLDQPWIFIGARNSKLVTRLNYCPSCKPNRAIVYSLADCGSIRYRHRGSSFLYICIFGSRPSNVSFEKVNCCVCIWSSTSVSADQSRSFIQANTDQVYSMSGSLFQLPSDLPTLTSNS